MTFTRLFEILPHQLASHPKEDCLAAKENGIWKKYSTDEVVRLINQLSHGLLALGCQTNPDDVLKDKVALISNNRPEWNLLDNALLQIGVVNVPIYPTITDAEMEFIFNDAGIKYAFVSDDKLYAKVKGIQPRLTNLIEVFTFNDVPGARHFQEVMDLGKNGDASRLDSIRNNITTDDLATIIYTSGTTGSPKGVMLTHRNICSNINSCIPILLIPLNSTHRALSFLPLCHILERMVTFLLMTEGISIYYAESLETIADNMKEVQPHVFTTVPRLLEKVYDRIVSKGNELTGVKKKLFFWALDLGLRYEHEGANGWFYEAQLKLANKLIFSKWREALGNNVKLIVSGGAALQPRLARVFTAAQLQVLEGYGLSETSPVVAVNRPEPYGSCFGTVGPCIDQVSIRFEQDGEISVKGENIMKGYYKRPDLTAEVIDKDGYFHTGDIGQLIDNKYLKITDRKKELFKTSGGKYVAPQVVENKLKESIYIEQVMVVGEGQKFVGAIIVPSFAELRKWCEHNGINYSSNAEIIINPAVLKLFRTDIDAANQNLNHVEQVKRFELLPNEWTIASGELTPKLSLKRKVVTERCRLLIDKIFSV